jgi:hypothetical protein
VDVGKATIHKPKYRKLHNREMPAGVFKVHVAIVLAGFEDLPPPVVLEGDDETPNQLADCKGWYLPWPKDLLRVEAPGSTPMTKPQQGMNTTTPPTQLLAPVVVGGDSGRREAEPPLVSDHVPLIEEANADDAVEEEEDENPL